MPHHCEICDYTFEDGKTLKRHNTRLHPSQKRIQSKCNLCDYLYYTTEALEKHTLDIHRGKPTTGQKRQQKKTYKCQVCESPFSQNVSLQYHMKKYHQSITDHESSASDEESDGGNNSSDSDISTEPPDCPSIQDTAQNIEQHGVTDVTLMESESVQKLSNHKEIYQCVDLEHGPPTKPLPIHTKPQTNTTCDFESLKMEVCDGDADLECDEAMATSDNSDINIETEVKCEVEHSDSTEDIEEEDLMSIYQDLNRTHMVNVHCNNIQTENIKTESNNLDTFITHMAAKQSDIKHSYIPLTRCDTQGKMPPSVHPYTHQALQAQISSVQMISTTVAPAVENKPTKNHLNNMTITECEEQQKKNQEAVKNMTSAERDEFRRKRAQEQCRKYRRKKAQERRIHMTATDYKNLEKLRIKARERYKNLTSDQRDQRRIKQHERRKNSIQPQNARIKEGEPQRNKQLKNMTNERELCLRIKECGSTHYLQLHQYLEQQQNVMEDQKPDIRQENQTIQAQTSSVLMISAAGTSPFENKLTKKGKECKSMTSPERREKRRMRDRERRKNRTSEERERELNKRRIKNMTPTQRENILNKQRERRRDMTSTEREVERKKDHERWEKRRKWEQERCKNRTSEERERERIKRRERNKNMTTTQRENKRKKDREQLQNMTITQRENKRIRERERRKIGSQFEIQLRNDREWQQNVMEEEEQDHTNQENKSEEQQRCDVRAAAHERKLQKDRERRLNMTEEQKAARRESDRQRRRKQAERFKAVRDIAVLERQKIQDRIKQEVTDCGDQGTSPGQLHIKDSLPDTRPTVQDESDIFACSACQFKTLHLNHLLSHLTMEHKELNLTATICKVCGFRTNNSTELETHIATYSHDKCFTCEQCSATFLQPYHLTRHIRYSHESTKVLCPYCGCKYQAHSLKSHILWKHSTTPSLCNECGKQFSNQDKLNRHIQNAHTGPLSCTLCDYTCKRPATLQFHMDKHLGIKPRVTCDICGMGHTTPASLRVHMLSHSDAKPFKCNLCDYSSKMKFNVTMHIDRSHHKLKPNACDLCDFRAYDKTNILSHKWFKHNIGKAQVYKCTKPDCDYTAKSHLSLRRHRVKTHGEELASKYHCPHCEFKSYFSKNLEDHIRTHTGEKPFECPHCGFRCNVISNLRAHIKTHAKATNNSRSDCE